MVVLHQLCQGYIRINYIFVRVNHSHGHSTNTRRKDDVSNFE